MVKKFPLLAIVLVISSLIILSRYYAIYEIIYIGNSGENSSITTTKYGYLINDTYSVRYLSGYFPRIEQRYTKRSNNIYGYSGDSINICLWHNRSITNPNQNATYLLINTGEYKKLLKSELTVKPLICSKEKMILIDNYPNNPSRKYILNDERLKQIDRYPKIREQVNTDKLPLIFKKVFPPMVSGRKIYPHPSEKSILIEDNQNNFWIIYKTTPLRRGISYLQLLRTSE